MKPAREPRNSKTILVTGYARLPEAEAKGERAFFGLALEVDPQGDVIVRAEGNCHFALGSDFMHRLLVGRSLTAEFSQLVSEFELRCALPAQKTIIRSLQNAHNRYREFRLARGPLDSATAPPAPPRFASGHAGGRQHQDPRGSA